MARRRHHAPALAVYRDPGEDELADVLAVVEGLAHAHGKDLTTLHHLVSADPRGGFFTGRMMRGHHPDFDGEPTSP